MKPKNQIQNQKGKRFSRSFFFVAFLLLSFVGVQAQEITVTGVISSSEDKETLIGATVMDKSTGTGVITDIDGKFSIKTVKGNILTITYTGMASREVEVKGAVLNIVMDPDVEMIEEVVVIGYGTATKKEIAGAVTQVKAEDLNQVVTSDVATALQGQVAGVNVAAASGSPGEAAEIQIRGVNSLSGTNTPLYVVDGIPQDGTPRLSRNEIETIDILKDAASASVYGTRGSAGVILITTKRGQKGKTKVSFDQSFGVQKITSGVDLMTTAEQIRFDTLKVQYVPGATTNILNREAWWTNETNLNDFILTENPLTQTYDLGIMGGSEHFAYNVTGGYFNQQGMVVNTGFERYNGRINASYNKGKLSMRAIAAMTSSTQNISGSSLLLYAIRYKPYYPSVDINATSYETDGGESETVTNYLIQQLKKTNTRQRDIINGSVNLGYDITESLKFTTNLGTNITNVIGQEFVPFYETVNITTDEIEVDPTKSYAEMNHARLRTYSIDAGLTYKKKFKGHNITAVLAYSLDERSYQYFEAGKQGVSNNEIQVINGGTINPYANSGNNYTIKTLGTLGRVQYNYKGRYILSGSIRRDGSSKFAPENRWGIFPSISAAWNVASEDFWKPFEDITDNFKIRASYGRTGNESFPAYRYSPVIYQGADYVFGTNTGFGSVQRTYANSQVQWETSIQTNLGFDLGFWKNKLTVAVDLYKTNKEDMLFPVQLPASAGAMEIGGYSNLILNVGNMTNRGVEVAANYKNRFGDWKVNIGGTFTKNQNEITSINGSSELIMNTSQAVIGDPASRVTALAVGHEVGAYFLYQTDGVVNDEAELTEYRMVAPTAQLGDLKYIDTNGDSIISEEDRVYSGSALPDFEFGVNLKLNYKNFDFTMLWYGAVGHELINGSAAYAYNYGRHADLTDMWTPENTTSNIPIHRGSGKDHANYSGATDYWLEDGTYLRLRAVTLGYSMPRNLIEKVGLGSFRIYISAQNPLTFTDYTGYDPEVGGNVANRGLDTGRIPMTSQYLFGIQLDF